MSDGPGDPSRAYSHHWDRLHRPPLTPPDPDYNFSSTSFLVRSLMHTWLSGIRINHVAFLALNRFRKPVNRYETVQLLVMFTNRSECKRGGRSARRERLIGPSTVIVLPVASQRPEPVCLKQSNPSVEAGHRNGRPPERRSAGRAAVPSLHRINKNNEENNSPRRICLQQRELFSVTAPLRGRVSGARFSRNIKYNRASHISSFQNEPKSSDGC